MSIELSFNVLGDGGFINPTPWSFAIQNARISTLFYETSTGTFSRKQTSDFDGGWRWFDAYDLEAITIYNQRLDRRAYFHLSILDVQRTRLQPEILLYWAKCMVLVEHNFYVATNWLEDSIRASARRAMIEITKEIRGEPENRSHLHPVR